MRSASRRRPGRRMSELEGAGSAAGPAGTNLGPAPLSYFAGTISAWRFAGPPASVVAVRAGAAGWAMPATLLGFGDAQPPARAAPAHAQTSAYRQPAPPIASAILPCLVREAAGRLFHRHRARDGREFNENKDLMRIADFIAPSRGHRSSPAGRRRASRYPSRSRRRRLRCPRRLRPWSHCSNRS